MTFLTAPPSAAPITSPGSDETKVKEPKWIYEKTDSFGEHFTLPEWEDHPENEHEGYREKNGWKVCHILYKTVFCALESQLKFLVF
jgi:hypothetical protein